MTSGRVFPALPETERRHRGRASRPHVLDAAPCHEDDATAVVIGAVDTMGIIVTGRLYQKSPSVIDIVTGVRETVEVSPFAPQFISVTARFHGICGITQTLMHLSALGLYINGRQTTVQTITHRVS